MKDQPALAAACEAPALTAIVQAELKIGWGAVGPGTLPTRAVQGDAGGMWRNFISNLPSLAIWGSIFNQAPDSLIAGGED